MLISEFATLKRELNINQFQVGLLITFFSLPAAIFIPFLGFLSDRFGRKIIIVPCILVYGMGGMISGIASVLLNNPYNVILAGRVVQGIGAAGTGPIAMALAGDIFKARELNESMGIMEAANGIGKFVSPVIGSAIALIIWYALFFSYSILCIPVAFLLWLTVKEQKNILEKKSIKEYINAIKPLFYDKGLFLSINFLGALVVLFILFGVLSFASNILETNFRLSGINRGIILSVPLFFLSASAYLTGLYLRKEGNVLKYAYFYGLITISLSMFILPFCSENIFIYTIMLGFLGTGSGLVLTSVNTMVTGSIQAYQRGGVTSLYGSVRFLGIALGPPVFSLLQGLGVSLSLLFLASGILALLSGFLGFLIIRKQD